MENNMEITITGHQIDVTPAVREFILEKIKKLERHSLKIQNILIFIKVEQSTRHIAEGEVIITKGKLHASAESENMYTSIDHLIDKLNAQLIKNKEKIIDRRDDPDDLRDTAY